MKSGKKLALCVTILALLLGAVSASNVSLAKTNVKKYGYLGGDNGYKDLKFKYKGNTLYLKGYAWKTDGSKYPDHPSSVEEKIKINTSVKIGNNCKINIGTEPETNFKFKDKKKVKQFCGKKNKWFSAPRAYVIIKGNEAVFLTLGS